MSLSTQDAAAQFELYAEAFEKDAADLQVSFDRFAPTGMRGLESLSHRIDVAQRQAHQLRFCAAFLRDHCIP